MMQPPGCLYMACLTQIGNHIVAFSLDSGPVRRLHPGMTADAVGDGGDAGRIAKGDGQAPGPFEERSEEHTSELQSLMRISYAVFCLKQKTRNITNQLTTRKHQQI